MSDINPERCNGSALRQAARHVSRHYDEALAPAGLGLNQYAILGRLDRLGPRTIQDLAGHLVMDRSTLGHLLRPLESRGWVSLDTSCEDRRCRRITLTAAGLDMVRAARPLWAEAQRRFEQLLGAEAALGLRTALKRVEALDFRSPLAEAGGQQSPEQGGERSDA